MKRFLLLSLLVIAGLSAASQDYSPTSTWPYLYEDFQEGTIYMRQGTKMIQKLNVHIAHSRLHYLDNGTIRQLSAMDVVAVFIGEDKYILRDDVAYRVLASSDNGVVLRLELGDFTALNETGGAYGTSSTSSATNKLATIAYDNQVNQNVMLVLQSKGEGVELGRIKTLYLQTSQGMVKASAKEVEKAVGPERKAAWKAWQKEHKIKWSDPDSIVDVLGFIAG